MTELQEECKSIIKKEMLWSNSCSRSLSSTLGFGFSSSWFNPHARFVFQSNRYWISPSFLYRFHYLNVIWKVREIRSVLPISPFIGVRFRSRNASNLDSKEFVLNKESFPVWSDVLSYAHMEVMFAYVWLWHFGLDFGNVWLVRAWYKSSCAWF